ncbi:MAG TPA: thioredoxin family protein [Gemmataceae bacterium]|nr:thioredoxin family protein [Gemmataceae bacterium]
MRLTLATLLAAVGYLLCPALASAQFADIQFRHDYNETRKEADKKGLPLVLYFTTDNCPWCVKLQRDTFADPAVAKVMNDKFVPLKVFASQEPKLVELLNVRAFPTIILAGPDGKILMTVEGYQDAARFHDSLQRVLAAVSNPDWMLRDYQIAVKSIGEKDYAKGVALLKTILEDGKTRPVQVNAANLLQQLEQQAAAELAQAKQMLDKGKTNEASAVLTKLVKDYAGTTAAPEAAGMLTSIAKTPEIKGVQRLTRARELLAQAKEDYRTEQWLCCLDRCDLLSASYGDLPEAREAKQMATAIRSNPEWMQKSCESMTTRLADMYLSLAETWLQKGQPQQAMLCLERVILTFPGTRQADAARARMLQLQGLPSQQTGFQPR